MSAQKKARGAVIAGGGAILIAVMMIFVIPGISSPHAAVAAPKIVKPDTLGPFNHNPKAPSLPTTTLTPQGARGACWPSNTFNYLGAEKDVVTYLQGKDPRDKAKTYQVVTERDTAWLNAYRTYYNYTPGQTDAAWHQGLVLKQLPYAITVMDTYCPDGQQNVQQWQVQTLQPGELVYFLKGHAPGDGTNIIPVRKANCGNFLLPPPPQASQPPQHVTVTPKPPTPVVHRNTPPPVVHKPPPPVCQYNCNPRPPQVCVPPPFPGNGWVFNSKTCTYHKAQTVECMRNGGPGCPPNGGVQPPQNNTTSGVNTGRTPGAPLTAPQPLPKGPTPVTGQRAPAPNANGYDSGSKTGSGTPGGTTCNSSGCTGGGAKPGSGKKTDTTQSADNNGTSNGTSTGGGTIVNPFG